MSIDPIKHIIVLMLENRSFDQMLGCFGPSFDGVDPAKPGMNVDDTGTKYEQKPTVESSFPFDPRHEWEHVEKQLAGNNGGFVKDFAEAYSGKVAPDDYHGIMDYFGLGQVPAHPSTGGPWRGVRSVVFVSAGTNMGESLLCPFGHFTWPSQNGGTAFSRLRSENDL